MVEVGLRVEVMQQVVGVTYSDKQIILSGILYI